MARDSCRLLVKKCFAFVIITLFCRVDFFEGCEKPGKDLRFGELALRSDVVIEATPTTNQLKKTTRYSVLFRVTKTFNSKQGNLSVGQIFLSGLFGDGKKCIRPIPRKKYILFLKSSKRSVRGRYFYKIRYNPVPSSARNVRYFKNVLAGKLKGPTILSSGCKRMRVPKNSKLDCSSDNVRCKVSCNKGFIHNTGRTLRTCNAATGSWYPAKSIHCTNGSLSSATNKRKTALSEDIRQKSNKNTSLEKEKVMKGNTADKMKTVENSARNRKSNRGENTTSPGNKFPNVTSSAVDTYITQNSTPTMTIRTESYKNTTFANPISTTYALQSTSTAAQIITVKQRQPITTVTTTQVPSHTSFSEELSIESVSAPITSPLRRKIKPTTSIATLRPRKPRPILPTYRPLKPLASRSRFVQYRRRQYDIRNQPLTPPSETPSRNAFSRARPPLPVFRPLAPLRSRLVPSRRQLPTFRPLRVAVLKAATPAEVNEEEIEKTDKSAIDRIGDEWATEDGLIFKPELGLNDTVYGCPRYEANMTVFGEWLGGFNAMVKFEKLTKPIVLGWLVRVEFETPIIDMEPHVVDIYTKSKDGRMFTFSPKPYMEVLHLNQDLTVAFVARMDSSQSIAPPGKGFLLGRCHEEMTNGETVSSMSDRNTVVDRFGQNSLPQQFQAATGTTTSASTIPRATEPTPPPRSLTVSPTGTSTGPPVVARPRSANLRIGRIRSANTRSAVDWQTNRCLASSPNGELPKGGMMRPKWKLSKAKSKYDYNEVLHKSGLFFLAQKSGKLPKVFPIPWRGDSALKDGCSAGHELYGGLYSGGGHEKSTIAIAFTTTMLAWGAIDYKAAYTDSGEYDNVVKLVKENAKYLIRCHIAKEELVVQVGNHDSSGLYWSRPEDVIVDGRSVHTITRRNPGQDVAAETAAALAASSILIKSFDAKLSQECVKHAKELDAFARQYSWQYSRSIPKSVNSYHTMSGSLDNMAWALLWLGKATNNYGYYKRAEAIYSKISSTKTDKFDWAEKTVALPILLTKFAKNIKYKWKGRQIINMYRAKAAKSHNKQLWLSAKGTNMLTANAAFLALQVAHMHKGFRFSTFAMQFAEQQLHLLLGDGGRSYVVGFGKNFPRRPRHMASSCKDVPSKCDSSILLISSDSPHILHGALVGGPGRNGEYNDVITETLQNEVAIDFNAGFQSAIAGLKQAKMSSGSRTVIRRIGQPVRKNVPS